MFGRRTGFGVIKYMKRYTEEELNILNIELKNGKSLKSVSEKINRSYMSVFHKAKELGLNTDTKSWSREEVKEISSLIMAGERYGSIALKFGVAKCCIDSFAAKRKIKSPNTNKRNIEIDKKCIELYNAGETFSGIEKIMNISDSTVGLILKEHNIKTDISKIRKINAELKKDGMKRCPKCEKTFLKNAINDRYCVTCRRKKEMKLYKKRKENPTIDFILKKCLKSAVARSKKKLMKIFDIDLEYLEKLYKIQNGKCFHSGIDMDLNIGSQYCISIDRIDSSKGYEIENVCLSCRAINIMKNIHSSERFYELCRIISTFQSNRGDKLSEVNH